MAKKVLIIDDSVTQLSSLKIFFKRNGFDVETAKDGLEGFIKVYKCAPDCIMSDVLMPHLGGFQLCRLLKSNKETHDIPFIMLTVLDKNLDKFWGTQSGADVFLRKDFDMKVIVEATKEIIEKMPVSESYKKELSGYEVEEDEVVGQINKILDEELMKTTITNKFRTLTNYTEDDKKTAEDIFGILSAITDYDLACIYFNSPDPAQPKRLIFHEQNVAIGEKDMLEVWRQILGENASDFRAEKITNEETPEIIDSIDYLLSKKELDFHYCDVLTGKVCFYSKKNIRWNKMRFMQTMKSEMDLFLRLKYLYTKTCYLSVTDELTKLHTRRHMQAVLTQEFERAKRYKSSISAAMVDIDDFKKINDTYGHLAGDFILREVSKIFIQTLRKTDFIYRYGGEEICVLMPETSVNNALIPLERLRKTIEQKNFTFEGTKIKVTVSIGIAEYKKEMHNADEFIEKADEALYRAKKSGKNKVVVDLDE